MAEAIPQLDPAGDADDAMGADASVPGAVTDTDSGGPSGQPRAKVNPEEKFQAKYDKVVNQVGKLLSSNYLKTLGGDGIVRALEQFEAILSHPDTAKSVKESLTQTADGKWRYAPASVRAAAAVDAAAGMGDGTDYEDPTVKALKSYLDERLSPLVDRITALQERSEVAVSAGGQQKIADMTRKFLAEYPLSPEERAEFGEALSRDIANLDSTMLLRMDYDQFRKRVALPNAEPFIPAALARKAKQRGSQLASLATDANGTASLGADQTPAGRPKFKSMNQLNKELAAMALRAAQEPA